MLQIQKQIREFGIDAVVEKYSLTKRTHSKYQNLPNMNGVDSEGYVVVDAEFNRVKIKSPHYVALHRLKGEYFNKKRALELILLGETSEVLTYFPEWTEEIKEVENAFNEMKIYYEEVYKELSGIESQKEYAIQVQNTDHISMPGILYSMRRGKTFDEAVRDVQVKSVIAALGLE